MTINDLIYWNLRFSSGDWKQKSGEQQTRTFMTELIDNLPDDIKLDIQDKTICDVGCALADGLEALNQHFPTAKLTGMDFSDEEIRQCKLKYPQFNFYTELNEKYYCLISSNVLEHLTNYLSFLEDYTNYSDKYIIILVPHNQEIEPNTEHVLSFLENTFPDEINEFEKIYTTTFYSEGWFADQLLVVYERLIR